MIENRKTTLRALHELVRNRRAAAALEFAFVMPIMTLMLFAIINFGIALNNRLVLTDGARAAVRELAVGRESATVHTDTTARFKESAAALDAANLSLTIYVDNAVCASDATCKTALSAASGKPAKIVASYPCDLRVLGFDFAPACALGATTSERIE